MNIQFPTFMNILITFGHIWSLEMTECDQMLSKCSKMLEIGCQKCDQMLAQNVLEYEKKFGQCHQSNVTFRVSGGAGMLSNVTKMFINVGNGMLKM